MEEIIALKSQVKQLTAANERNKIFTYMVVHDVKHPTESMIAQLQQQKIKLERMKSICREVEDS
jgi:hypothetical protein